LDVHEITKRSREDRKVEKKGFGGLTLIEGVRYLKGVTVGTLTGLKGRKGAFPSTKRAETGPGMRERRLETCKKGRLLTRRMIKEDVHFQGRTKLKRKRRAARNKGSLLERKGVQACIPKWEILGDPLKGGERVRRSLEAGV